jgi:hypothetical protein
MVLVERKSSREGVYSCQNQVAGGLTTMYHGPWKTALELLPNEFPKPIVFGWVNVGILWAQPWTRRQMKHFTFKDTLELTEFEKQHRAEREARPPPPSKPGEVLPWIPIPGGSQTGDHYWSASANTTAAQTPTCLSLPRIQEQREVCQFVE